MGRTTYLARLPASVSLKLMIPPAIVPQLPIVERTRLCFWKTSPLRPLQSCLPAVPTAFQVRSESPLLTARRLSSQTEDPEPSASSPLMEADRVSCRANAASRPCVHFAEARYSRLLKQPMSRLLSLMRTLPARRFSSFRQRISFSSGISKAWGNRPAVTGPRSGVPH